MDPILKIVNYLFKKQNIDTTVDNFNSFFDDGISFPKLIAMVFNIDSIPNINKNPKTIYHRKVNNDLAIEYLFKNNTEIAKISPTYNTERNKANLIALILTKQCFKINQQEIINKCNMIVRSLGVQFTKKSDILDQKCILSLLNVLTDGEVQLNDGKNDNFDDLMTKSFEKAKVPLVINKTSLEIENQFTFFIQIEIIFGFFAEKIRHLCESKGQKEEEQKDDENLDIENKQKDEVMQNFEFLNADDDDIEKINDRALLRVMNVIGEEEKIHFTSINQTIENDNLPKFVKIILKERSDIETIDKIIEKVESPTEKINEIIKYLGETRKPNEPLFTVLRFNFEDPNLVLNSATLFYTNFLNTYFLKSTNFKLFERCSTIIYGNINSDDAFYLMYIKNIDKRKNPYNDKNLLFKWDTYLALVNFVNNNSTHYQIDRSKKDDFYFKQNNIPQIINEKYLKHFPKKIPDIIFYQLQLIFNVLDSKSFVYNFHESLLRAERLVKQFTIPPFKELSDRIVSMYSSLNVQKKKFIEFIESKDLNDSTAFQPDPYIQRRLKYSQSLNESYEKKEDLFWNPVIKTTLFDKGVLYQDKIEAHSQKVWLNEIINFHNNVCINQQMNQNQKLFTSVNIENIKPKLYKFFHYDESLKKWQIDTDCINQFIEDKHLKEGKVKTPLILFSNAYEKDLIILNSKFIKTLYPDLDDDNIYIYAFCDKPLTLLQYNVTTIEENNEDQIKPIFLLFHVPKNKQKTLKSDEDIKMIMFKIYYFLSIICDIEIIILNRDHCLEQLDFIKNVNNVKRSYNISATEKLHQLSANNIDFLSSIENSNEMNDALEKADFNIWEKKSKYIILFNDDTIKGDIIEPDESDFAEYIKKKIDSDLIKIHYININDPFTYRSFLTSFNKMAMKVNAVFKQTLESFDLYHLTEISNMYINLKSKDEWKTDLKTEINNRFNQLIEMDCGESNEYSILSKLNKEIVRFCPAIDAEFYNECSSNLIKINHLITQKNKRLLKLELNLSSEHNLKHIASVINSLSIDEKNEIEKNHIDFLKNEFSDIISKLYEIKDLKHFIDKNQSILDTQIKSDVEKIHKLIDKNDQ